MSVKRRTVLAEQMTDEQSAFWMRAFLKSLPEFFDIKKTPEFCAHLAADVADAAVRELRRRIER